MTQETLVDVRSLPPRERHPLIFKSWDELALGAALKLVNDHDPKPLFYQFQAERPGEFQWTAVESGPVDWVVEIKRVAPGAARPAAAPEHACGCASKSAPAWAAKTPDVELDVREGMTVHKIDVCGLEPPEPMTVILTKIHELGPKDVLEVTHFREPLPLYPHLEEAGFDHDIRKLEDGLFLLRIMRKP